MLYDMMVIRELGCIDPFFSIFHKQSICDISMFLAPSKLVGNILVTKSEKSRSNYSIAGRA
jgi:hypothetical protein